MREKFISIEIGKYKTVDTLKKAVLKDNKIGDFASKMLEKITLSKKEKIDLVKITVSELGFTSWTKLSDIYVKAEELGYELCSQETGAYLRIEDRSDNCYVVAMKPITGSDGDPSVFNLAHDDSGLWLNDDWATPGDDWLPDDGFVFRLRKSLKTLETSDTLSLKYLETRIEKLENKLQAIGELLK